MTIRKTTGNLIGPKAFCKAVRFINRRKRQPISSRPPRTFQFATDTMYQSIRPVEGSGKMGVVDYNGRTRDAKKLY